MIHIFNSIFSSHFLCFLKHFFYNQPRGHRTHFLLWFLFLITWPKIKKSITQYRFFCVICVSSFAHSRFSMDKGLNGSQKGANWVPTPSTCLLRCWSSSASLSGRGTLPSQPARHAHGIWTSPSFARCQKYQEFVSSHLFAFFFWPVEEFKSLELGHYLAPTNPFTPIFMGVCMCGVYVSLLMYVQIWIEVDG